MTDPSLLGEERDSMSYDVDESLESPMERKKKIPEKVSQFLQFSKTRIAPMNAGDSAVKLKRMDYADFQFREPSREDPTLDQTFEIEFGDEKKY